MRSCRCSNLYPAGSKNPSGHHSQAGRRLRIRHKSALNGFTDEASASSKLNHASIPMWSSQMLLSRLCFCIQIILMASLAIPMPHALARSDNLSLSDQPGLVPDAADEQLSPELQRQMVDRKSTRL